MVMTLFGAMPQADFEDALQVPVSQRTSTSPVPRPCRCGEPYRGRRHRHRAALVVGSTRLCGVGDKFNGRTVVLPRRMCYGGAARERFTVQGPIQTLSTFVREGCHALPG